MSDGVFVIPIFERFLVHAPLVPLSALVNRTAATMLARGIPVSGLEIKPVLDPPHPREGPLCPQFLGLIPTRACNLRCTYCGFGAAGAGGEEMDPRTAAAAVDWMAVHTRQRGDPVLEVHFFGGEPFAAPDTIEVAVHRARAAAEENGLTSHIEAATNGVFPEGRARWVGDYLDTIVLSFDGFREVHDRRRPHADGRGSYAEVENTARVLSESPAEFCLRICVGEDNVDALAETTAWLAEEYRPSTIDFETLQPVPGLEGTGFGPPDPCRFAAGFRRARAEAAAHGVTANYAAALREAPRLSFCPVGNDSPIIGPDGRVSACYLIEREWQARSLDLSLGLFSAGHGMELAAGAVERTRNLVARRPRCERCFCRWSCAGGCHVMHSHPGCPEERDDFCLQTRIITACEILEELGAGDVADRLLASRPEMERMARRSDAASDLEGSHA